MAGGALGVMATASRMGRVEERDAADRSLGQCRSQCSNRMLRGGRLKGEGVRAGRCGVPQPKKAAPCVGIAEVVGGSGDRPPPIAGVKKRERATAHTSLLPAP